MPFNGKICIIGLGYIGLPTGAMFADRGINVVGVDIRSDVVNGLNAGHVILEEPGLAELASKGVKSGKLRASVTPEEADAFIIAVGTPIKEDRTADMTAVASAAQAIVPYIKKGDLVVLESTSPPGTVENLIMPILAKSGLNPAADLYLSHAPERVFPGSILRELIENDRIVGGITPEAAQKAADMYRVFVEGGIHLTDASTAELTKLMENTFRNVNIGLANELLQVCDRFGSNVWEVIRLANKHPRVNLLQPGPGVGGHCIAVDPWFVVEKAPELAKIMHLSLETNDAMPEYVCEKVKSITGGGSKKVAVFGVTFKPDTDDIRESPISELIAKLRESGCEVAPHDPHKPDEPGLFSSDEAVRNADILILGVHHKEFANVDFARIKSLMKTPVILDTRNFWSGHNLAQAGFDYHLLGGGRQA